MGVQCLRYAGYDMSVIWTSDGTKDKHDCIKTFCESLKEHTMKIINFEKNKMIPLAKQHQ